MDVEFVDRRFFCPQFRLQIWSVDISQYVPPWSGDGIGYRGNCYISQLGETFYRGMREYLTISTYSISIIEIENFQ